MNRGIVSWNNWLEWARVVIWCSNVIPGAKGIEWPKERGSSYTRNGEIDIRQGARIHSVKEVENQVTPPTPRNLENKAREVISSTSRVVSQ